MLSDIKNNSINYTTTKSNRQDRERSKREDLDCNCKDLEYLHKQYETYIQEYDNKAGVIIKNLLDKSKMRCSEHCGNTVRKVQ
jgi:hypothetical protein